MKKCVLKYFTYEQLKRFNQSSIRAKRNKNFNWNILKEEINQDDLFPIISLMIHNDKEIRVNVALGKNGINGWLDISFKQYDQLDDRTIEERFNFPVQL
ncbi:uncharacterized protein METZ01_LOCUS60727 [marine metagenome]|uniref:Uncharacterized protein n=1 Tax=marine metagenome TaxID=408172 RepID=A0A381T2I0_9ZZZZ